MDTANSECRGLACRASDGKISREARQGRFQVLGLNAGVRKHVQSWRKVQQTGNSARWQPSACPSASGRSKRCPYPTMGARSTIRGQKGGGGATQKRQAPGPASGVNFCKCCELATDSRPQDPHGSAPGGRLKRSARAVQLFGRLAVLETHTLRY